MIEDKEKWLSIREAVRLTGVCDKTIRNWIKTKKIVSEFSEGFKKWRILRQSLLEFIEYK
jgi:excisionase family DNA binding protein